MSTNKATSGPDLGPPIGPRMAAVMLDLEAVGKNRRNEQQRYTFRGIDDFYNSLHPVLAKHGVHMLVAVEEHVDQEPQQTKSGGVMFRVKLKARVAFVAPDGSERAAVMWAEGADTGDKSTNKAISAAVKYALLTTFAVPTEDNELRDSERDSHEAAPARRQAQAPQPGKPSADEVRCDEALASILDALAKGAPTGKLPPGKVKADAQAAAKAGDLVALRGIEEFLRECAKGVAQ